MPSLRLLLLLGLAALLQGCAATIIRTSCETPRVSNFSLPASHIVMLPYRHVGEQGNEGIAEKLNQFARLQALQGAVHMKSTQITLVDGDPNSPACGIERVYERVVDGSGQRFWRRPFHSAIFLWGQVYDRDDDFVVQSHLRVYWNGAADRELEVSIDSPGLPRPLRFGGDLPDETLSFPPRRLTRTELDKLDRLVRDSLLVRSAPDVGAAEVQLPTLIAATEWKPPWLRVVDRSAQRNDAWILVSETALDDGGLATPEALFARALAAYLNVRRASAGQAARERAADALAQFRETMKTREADGPAARLPLAIATVLQGTLGLPAAADSMPAPGEVAPSATADVPVQYQRLLKSAADQLPAHGGVINLAAISLLPGCCDGDDAPQRIAEIDHLFRRAEALSEGDLKVAANLVNWYRYVQTLPETRLPFSHRVAADQQRRAAAALEAWSNIVER